MKVKVENKGKEMGRARAQKNKWKFVIGQSREYNIVSKRGGWVIDMETSIAWGVGAIMYVKNWREEDI